MKKTALRIISGCVCMAMLIPLVSCKKKEQSIPLIESTEYKSGKVIQEIDPFFDSEVNLIKLPLEEGREVDDVYCYPHGYYGNVAVADYDISYKTPQGVHWSELPYEEHEKYRTTGIGIFDSHGNYLRDIPDDIVLVYDVASDPDGRLCILGYGDGTKEKWKKVLLCAILDKDGGVAKRIAFTGGPFDPGCMFNPKLGFLSDGRYSVQEQSSLYVFSQDGDLNYTISDPGRTIGTGIFSENGKNYVLSFSFDFETGENIQIREVNTKTGELGKNYDVSNLAAFGDLYPTGEGLFVTSGTGCYKYDIEANKLSKFFDWSDTDVNRALFPDPFVCPLVPRNTNELYAIGLKSGSGSGEFCLIHLTRAEKNPHVGKKLIIVGGVDFAENRTLMTFVSAYNSDPENPCRAVLVDYSEDMQDGTSRADVENRVFQDILAGDGPDLLVNFSESSVFQRVTVMEDLNPYLDGPDGISRDEYFDNILRAQEKNGQLFHIPIRFALSGLMANTKYISNTIGWTFDEFEEASSGMPNDVGFIENILYKDFLAMLLSSTMSSFVNYTDKTCDFQNETMKKYLQVARKYGVERLPEDEGTLAIYDGNRLRDGTEEYYEFQFESGLIALHKHTIQYLDWYGHYRRDFKAPSVFLGYPSLDGSGAAIKSFLSVGIVSTSKYKDLAWDFLRELLEYTADPEFRDSPFPINRELFENECHEVIRISSLATEQDLQEVREIIEAAETTICYDAAMLDVITEEAAAYFAGDRSEEDVLKNIQNRCDLIVKERG